MVSHPVHAVLHRPRTIGGVDRFLVFWVLCAAVGVWLVSTSIVVGLLTFAGFFLLARSLTRRDPQQVDIWRVSVLFHGFGLVPCRTWDPGKHAPVTWRVLERP